MTRPISEMTRAELVDEVERLQQRNADLAAHVGRLTGSMEMARDRIALLAGIATGRGAKLHAALNIWPEEMEKVLAESPETSLTHLKAQWQAEALEHASDRVALAVEADTVRAHLRNQAGKLRRQAEGGGV